MLTVGEVFGIEGLVVLGFEETRRPPAFEALEGVPFVLPLCFQVEEEDASLHRILAGFVLFTYLQSIAYYSLNIQVINNKIQLRYG